MVKYSFDRDTKLFSFNLFSTKCARHVPTILDQQNQRCWQLHTVKAFLFRRGPLSLSAFSSHNILINSNTMKGKYSTVCSILSLELFEVQVSVQSQDFNRKLERNKQHNIILARLTIHFGDYVSSRNRRYYIVVIALTKFDIVLVQRIIRMLIPI